jgi:hypothetical protein
MYDVCGQVVKNLAYLKADAMELPGKGQKWNHEWRLKGGRVARVRAGPGGTAIRNALSSVRSNPNAQRAFWMVLGGGMLSQTALEQELSRAPPQPHVLQFAHLVLSVFGACQSVGADFRIFCAD